jgi:hypothetical protein
MTKQAGPNKTLDQLQPESTVVRRPRPYLRVKLILKMDSTGDYWYPQVQVDGDLPKDELTKIGDLLGEWYEDYEMMTGVAQITLEALERISYEEAA